VDAGSSHHLIERKCAMASRFLVPYSTSRGWMQDPLYQLQREIDRVFEDVFSGGTGGTGASNAGGRSGSMMSAPRIDLRDSEGELRLHADLPGVQPSDLDIRVEGDVLTIRGERKSESDRNEQNFHVMERSHGRFQRSIQLPFAPDPEEVEATVREGVLEVRIPKRAPQERSRRIEVRGAESGGGQSMTGAISGGSGIGSSSGGAASQSVGGGSSSSGGSGSSSDGGAGSSSGGSGSSSFGAGSSSGSAGSSPGRGGSSSSDGAKTDQGPGGSNSVTPGVGGEGGTRSSSGMAGVSGGPTAAPAGETSAKR
jgi:HSP20 family protein